MIVIQKDFHNIKYQNNPSNVKSFEFSDYQYHIENFSSDEDVGPIIDAEEAVAKAEEVWKKVYGESVEEEKPYQVFYDEKNEIWLVHGTLEPNMKGGVAYILIESTGKVLAVWHEK